DITTGNWFQVERMNPVAYRTLSDGHYFYDFGKAAFGTLELNYELQKEESITVHLGEKLLDGRIDRKPGGSIRYQQVQVKMVPGKNTFQIELVPDKRNTNHMAVALPDSFPVVMPFRYVEVEGNVYGSEGGKASGPDDVVQIAYFNYFDDTTSSFSSSDSILNQIWEMCKYSQKVTTFAGVYIDGDRERIPYEADAYLNQLSHYSVDKEYAIARKTIEYFMEKPTWPTEWQLHVALLFYQDYMYTGNTELIEKYYEPLKHKTLMALEMDDGFISVESKGHTGELMMNLGFADTTQRLRDIVDWPQKGGFGGVMGEDDGFVFTSVNTVVNSMYYGNMKIMAEFAKLLCKPEDELDFEYRAARVRKAINEKLYDNENGYYVDGIGTGHGSIHANMFPLAFGVVPEARKQKVVNHIKSRGMACSVYAAQYLMEAVYNAGDEDYALDLMTATHDRSWYNMIKVGSTVSMEAWDMKYKPNSDWNHAWGAAPANIIPRYMWGVKPFTPGYGVAEIKPQMSTLKTSSIKIPTIKGTIAGEYRMLNRNLKQFKIKLPSNMTANFIHEGTSQQVISLNGKTINNTEGMFILNPGMNVIDIRVNSF
ncbi:MAG TPA: family 78 glycoside hydrolase catalytic domain, partial [Mariniphaga sp.]|nr:family 78 glycoside hydrolase catalytic domain [Mariniphaga sp.]